MPDRVQLRSCRTGEVRDFFPVDATELLATGEWMEVYPLPPNQVSGPKLERSKEAAVVIGTGPCMKDDVSRVGLARFDVFGVNTAVLHYPCDHLVTWHAENLEHWRFQHQTTDRVTWRWPLTHSWTSAAKVMWEWGNPRGSSSLLAVFVAKAMGYPEIHIAGVPLSNDYERYRIGWMNHKWFLDGVYGISGWLAELLGTREN